MSYLNYIAALVAAVVWLCVATGSTLAQDASGSSDISLKPWPAIQNIAVSCTDSTITTEINEMTDEVKRGDHSLASASGKIAGENMSACYDSYDHPIYHLYQAFFYAAASIQHQASGQGPIPALVVTAERDIEDISRYSIPDPLQQPYLSVKAMIAKAQSAMAKNDAPAAQPAGDVYVAAEASLANDAFFSNCQVHHVPASSEVTTEDVLSEFSCVYRAHDYHAVEILGESLIRFGVKLDQANLYNLAYSYYRRGNNEEALEYARAAYSHLTTKDKTQCQSDIKQCSGLRQLLARIDPAYRARFAAEDSTIRAVQHEAAAEAAESAREAAAIAFVDSGNGIHSTEAFHVSGSWELDWSYDCSNFSDSAGNFIVEVDGDVSDVLVNQLGNSDSGTEFVHQGGNVYLKINSECSWTVKAVND